jgi:phage terminase large subunit
VELAHYVRELQNRDYLYGGYIAPHDAQAKELGTGKSRIELMQSLGLRSIGNSQV